MTTKSIRMPDQLLKAINLVEKEEKIEETTAIRKLIRIGYETYIARLYKNGKYTLGEVARLLEITPAEALEVLLDHGVKGNLRASEVIASLDRFLPQNPRRRA
jgi:predicted HTH domain antitoxin